MITTTTPEATPLTNVEGVTFDRVKLLENSIHILSRMEERLLAQRFKIREGDREYLAFVRAYSSLLATVNCVARDIEIEDLQRQLDELKAGMD